ncbi:MAG: hypothetical protein DYG88_05220 [Chloroflexi bacterium CFX4]|nr:hypothetical protein [Chloroflexi bacterium CFX4]MDL1924021.1 hypothetical protein [Chloroflexi bacterium CFX3]
MARRRLIYALIGICALYCILLVADLSPIARGHLPFLPETWYFPWLRLNPRLVWVLISIGMAGIYAFGAWHLVRRAALTHLKVWAFGGAALLPLTLMGMEGAPLFTLFARIASPDLGGYITAAALSGDLGTMLRDWLGFLARYQAAYPLGGIALAPPGLPILFHVSAAAFELVPPLAESFGTLFRSLQCQNPEMLQWSDAQWASALPALFMPLWSGLAIAPIYRLGARLFSRQTAVWAVALYPLLPSLAIFAPRFNTFYALLCAVLLVLVWEGLLRNRAWLIGLGGFVAGMGVFMNFAAVPLGLIGGFSILLWWWRERRSASSLMVHMAAFGLGTAAIWLIYALLTGITPFEILRASFDRHLALERPYLIYLFWHPYEMFLFTGIPIAGLALWRIGRSRHLGSHADLFAAAGALSLLLITLSGTARGETARVWLFFAPIWVLLAADVLGRTALRTRQSVIALQVLVLLSMGSTFRANFHILTPVPDPPPPNAPPSVALREVFSLNGDTLHLLGWRAETDSEGVTLHLYWQVPERQVRRLYQLALVPLPPDGSARPSLNWIPHARNYPPSCWTPHKTFMDSLRLPLTDSDPRGAWWFSLSVIDVQTRQPMLVNGTGQQVGIGALHMP